MNKDLLNQLPVDQQPIAAKLNSLVEDMQLSPTFQWELENQLLDTAKKKVQPSRAWRTKIIRALAWVVLALGAVYLLNWTMRSLASDSSPAAAETSQPQISFEEDVRQGTICAGPLALAHGFDVFLTNQNKTGFVALDEHNSIGELRSFAWSPDGRQLAIVGNTIGRGNIYLTNSMGDPLQPVLANSELGYLMGTSWSQDGKLLVTWSVQNNRTVYLLIPDGIGFVERNLPVQIFETPQFTPGHESITYYGADSSSVDGLLQTMLNSSRTTMISDLVEDEGSFAWSPDGLRLAYIEMDRSLGEARLVVHSRTTGDKVIIASLPIPKGPGSSIPSSANLGWSPDGKTLVFDFGRGVADRAVYIAYADGSGFVKVADSAHAPAISGDGRCLAYISDKQVFLIDLTVTPLAPPPPTPVLADLPAGRAVADFRLDKLQWRP